MSTNNRFPRRIKTVVEAEGDYRVIEIELPEHEAPPISQQAKLNVVGHEFPRREAAEKVTGTAKYSGDYRPAGMLYGKLVRSTKPSALIREVDLSEAERMPGVKAVLSLNRDRVNYVGDVIGAVAAETEEQAEDAVRSVKVVYEEERFVVNMDRAMRDNAPKVLGQENLGRPVEFSRGDVQAGFSQADVTVEGEYKTQIEIHNPIEPSTSMVTWGEDEILLYDATQTIDLTHGGVIRALNALFPDEDITENNVRLHMDHVGGGFGCKIGPCGLETIAARLSKTTNSPVLIMISREENSLDQGNRPDSLQKLKIGAKRSGELTAIELEGYSSVGAASRGSDNLAPAGREMYKCPNVQLKYQGVFLNAGRSRACRGPGHPQSFFAFESLMDDLAEELNIDPLELRLKNYAETSDGDTGRPYSSKGLMECYEKGAEAIGWSGRNKKAGDSAGEKKRGIGMSSLLWMGGGGIPGSVVEVDLFKDGSVNIRSGVQEIGTGTTTVMAQVAAEDLGISYDDVKVQSGDSSYPPGTPSYGSLATASICPSVRNAVTETLRKLYPVVAQRYNVSEDELEAVNGVIRVKDNPSRGMHYKDAIQNVSESKITGSGRRGPNPREYVGYVFGAHFCEVEVDIITGRTKVLKFVAAHDSGRIVNPMTCRNQVHGAVVQGISYTLMEQRIMDNRTGRMANPNYLDYKILPINEAPEIEVIFSSNIDPVLNSLGIKGIGEPPRIGVAGAVANAIYNASGVRVRDLPITPEKMLNGLKARKEGSS
ncbi:MAG: xanthine dehydrogenase family protein molybdopterin-binding subunit [bacterium]|nr:xanthine dehydrogenase family protein molybdopterin-binding subunit [bacterium]